MSLPGRAVAEQELEEAGRLNPGKWTAHSRYVAKACEYIAAACGMDSEKAYILGLLHDIGRRIGVVNMYHVYSGYRYCTQKGWDEVARICLTHSYLLGDAAKGVSDFDGNIEEYRFVEDYIRNVVLDDYDRLVQLADALGTADGFCIIEKRLVDVALRYGFMPYTLEKWRKFFELKEYFDQKCGCSVYKLLPGIEENL